MLKYVKAINHAHLLLNNVLSSYLDECALPQAHMEGSFEFRIFILL